jgi:DNA-binding GntR family transcriptional regulator
VTERLLLDGQVVDWGLHETMVDALGNEIISEIYRVNSLRIRLISLEHSMLLEQAMQEHLRFISALRERDATRARQLLDAHIDSARNRVVEASLGNFPGPATQTSAPARSATAKTMTNTPAKPKRRLA